MSPSHKSVKAIIFDLGNTLMHIPREFDEELLSAELLTGLTEDVVRTIAYRICNVYRGLSPDQFLAKLLEAPEIRARCNAETAARLAEIWYRSVEMAVPSSDAHSVLENLKSSGFHLALVSNTTPFSSIIIDRLLLQPYFETIVFSCNVGYLKPDPRIFKVALEALGTQPEETCVIGDKIRTDILGGQILGAKTVLLETRLSTPLVGEQIPTHAIISSLSDLLQLDIFRPNC